MPATPTYSPLPPQTHTQYLRTNPCRYAQYAEIPPEPLKGLRETRAVSVSYRAFVPAEHDGCGIALSYRALAPYGEIWSFPIEGNPSAAPTIVHCSLYIVHCFTFSAKERDSETGLSYFGSRYYSSDLSIWLSVDPQSDKYASLSPYVYCADNPVKLVDPNGDTIMNPYQAEYDFYNQQYSEAKRNFEAFEKNKDALGYSEALEALNNAKNELDEFSSLKYNPVNGAISNLKNYNRALYDIMNNYTIDGEAVVFNIWADYSIDNEGWHNLPTMPDCPKEFNILLNPMAKIDRGYTDMGEVLSHELGHLLYMIPHWTEYQNFLSTVNPATHNGHDSNDPSGIEANKQTRIYRKNKYRYN